MSADRPFSIDAMIELANELADDTAPARAECCAAGRELLLDEIGQWRTTKPTLATPMDLGAVFSGIPLYINADLPLGVLRFLDREGRLCGVVEYDTRALRTPNPGQCAAETQ
jgi:hypothetical protein